MNDLLDTASLQKEVAPIVEAATALVIVDLDSAQKAADLRAAIKDHHKKVKAFFAPHKKRADELHAALCADEKAEMVESNKALAILDAGLSEYRKTLDLIHNGDGAPKIDGLSFRGDWHGVVEDFEALVKSCAKGKSPLSLLTTDDGKMRDFAKSTKGEVKVPGVRFEMKNVPVGR